MNLFSTDGFFPRTNCGTGWSTGLVAFHIASNLGIALAYYAIPFRLWTFVRETWNRLPTQRAAWVWCGAFVLLCGTGHVIEGIIPFVWPIYRFTPWWHTFTAIVSWKYLFVLHSLTQTMRPQHTPDEYERIIAERDTAYKTLRAKAKKEELRRRHVQTALDDAERLIERMRHQRATDESVNTIVGHLADIRKAGS